MGTSTFSGPVVSNAGFITGPGAYGTPVTAATLTVDPTVQNGSVIPLNRAAGITVTLPASTGSQASYWFVLTATVTSNSTIIKVANSTDIMVGEASIGSAGTAGMFPAIPTADTITMNGSTTGGVAGSWVELVDIAPGFWAVDAGLVGSGIAATPFSATV